MQLQTVLPIANSLGKTSPYDPHILPALFYISIKGFFVFSLLFETLNLSSLKKKIH